MLFIFLYTMFIDTLIKVPAGGPEAFSCPGLLNIVYSMLSSGSAVDAKTTPNSGSLGEFKFQPDPQGGQSLHTNICQLSVSTDRLANLSWHKSAGEPLLANVAK